MKKLVVDLRRFGTPATPLFLLGVNAVVVQVYMSTPSTSVSTGTSNAVLKKGQSRLLPEEIPVFCCLPCPAADLLCCGVLGKQHDKESNTLSKLIKKAGLVVEVGPLCRHHREEEAVYSILDNDVVEEYVKQQTLGSKEFEGVPPEVLLSFSHQTLYSSYCRK